MTDLTDSTNLTRIIQAVKPDEIYNLAVWMLKKAVGWLGLSMPYQPRQMIGLEGSIIGRFV